MDVRIEERGSSRIAVVKHEGVLVKDVQDALNLMATVQHVYGCGKMIVEKQVFAEGFFDLKTRLAGEILQKFTNYRFKVAITGDFEVYGSKSLKDFIYESNKGTQVFFLPGEQAALEKLHGV